MPNQPIDRLDGSENLRDESPNLRGKSPAAPLLRRKVDELKAKGDTDGIIESLGSKHEPFFCGALERVGTKKGEACWSRLEGPGM